VRFVVPYAPGAINDAVARMLAQRLTESWTHPVIVDNRPGGGTIVGTEIVARSAPDAHTLLLTSVAHAITPALHSKLPYDVMRDFAYVTHVGYGPFVLAVHPGLGVDSVGGLIALARAKPNQLSYGSSGVGGGAHLATEIFKSMVGVRITHVAYKGGGPAIVDTLTGQVHMTFATPLALGGHLKSGKLRALAVSSAKRARSLPDLPTMAEACCPGYDAAPGWGVAVPAATPAPIVERLNTAIVRPKRRNRRDVACAGHGPYASRTAALGQSREVRAGEGRLTRFVCNPRKPHPWPSRFCSHPTTRSPSWTSRWR
jgi:tripartite-type tricarboxylate transporter receptor subunit TctC